MLMEICVYCYNYQRRWAWQLSSLVQQQNPPDILINIAYVKGNGDPSCEDLMAYYEGRGIDFNRCEYASIDEMKIRGFVRNRQLAISRGDVIFFADPDNVYSPRFLSQVMEQYKGEDAVYTAINKTSTDAAWTQKMVDRQTAIYFPLAYGAAVRFPILNRKYRKRVAPGCCQIVKKEAVDRLNNGLYIEPDKCCDRHIFRQKTLSDMQFRSRVGPSVLMHCDIQVHLNHWRKTDAEYSTEMQR